MGPNGKGKGTYSASRREVGGSRGKKSGTAAGPTAQSYAFSLESFGAFSRRAEGKESLVGWQSS